MIMSEKDYGSNSIEWKKVQPKKKISKNKSKNSKTNKINKLLNFLEDLKNNMINCKHVGVVIDEDVIYCFNCKKKWIAEKKPQTYKKSESYDKIRSEDDIIIIFNKK